MVENGTKKIKPISPTPADIKGRARISHNTTRKRTNFRLLNSRGPIGFHSQGNHCSISKLLGEGRPRRTKTFGAVYSCSRFGLASAPYCPPSPSFLPSPQGSSRRGRPELYFWWP